MSPLTPFDKIQQRLELEVNPPLDPNNEILAPGEIKNTSPAIGKYRWLFAKGTLKSLWNSIREFALLFFGSGCPFSKSWNTQSQTHKKQMKLEWDSLRSCAKGVFQTKKVLDKMVSDTQEASLGSFPSSPPGSPFFQHSLSLPEYPPFSPPGSPLSRPLSLPEYSPPRLVPARTPQPASSPAEGLFQQSPPSSRRIPFAHQPPWDYYPTPPHMPFARQPPTPSGYPSWRERHEPTFSLTDLIEAINQDTLHDLATTNPDNFAIPEDKLIPIINELIDKGMAKSTKEGHRGAYFQLATGFQEKAIAAGILKKVIDNTVCRYEEVMKSSS